jgi:hypothetical protein
VADVVVVHGDLVVVVLPAARRHWDQPVQSVLTPLTHPRCRGVSLEGS